MPLKRLKISPSELEKSRKTKKLAKNQVKKHIFGVFLAHTVAAQQVILPPSHSYTINALYSLASELLASLLFNRMASLPILNFWQYFFYSQSAETNIFVFSICCILRPRKVLKSEVPFVCTKKTHTKPENRIEHLDRFAKLSQSLAEESNTKHWRENISNPTFPWGSRH